MSLAPPFTRKCIQGAYSLCPKSWSGVREGTVASMSVPLVVTPVPVQPQGNQAQCLSWTQVVSLTLSERQWEVPVKVTL